MPSLPTDERRLGEAAETLSPQERNEGDSLPVESVGLARRILTPRVILFVFTAINFITYYDRGAIAGSLTVIKEDPSIAGSSGTLSDTKTGFLVSAFMIGYMTTCPIFASLGGYVPSKWVIVAGMVAWGIACLGTAFAHSYILLLISRTVVGIGEASFVGCQLTIIDQIAPRDSRTLWIGTYYSMIPVGTAVGMALGGVISDVGSIGTLEGWRVVFLSEVLVAIPIVLPVVFMPAEYNKLHSSEVKYKSFGRATCMLLKNPVYLLVVFGYAMYTFVVGAIAVWAIPMLVQGPMQITNMTASIIIGGVTALTGIFGSVAGGILLDKLGGSTGIAGVMKCQLFDALMVGLCIPLGIGALFSHILPLFVTLLVLSVFSLFTVTAPVNASILTVVPEELRSYAVSYCVLFIHLFGDFPSPTFVGLLSDNVFSKGCSGHDRDSCALDTANQCQWISNPKGVSAGHCVSEFQLRNALLIVLSILFLAIPSWLLAYFLLRRRNRRSPRTPEAVTQALCDTNGHNGSRDNLPNTECENLKSKGV